jgi:RNA polymerase sigma-70 factor (ECF subfamily)
MKNDLTAFRRIRAGDWDAFGDLFEEYSPQLYAYAFAFVGDRQAAEDIIQDTFVYLWTHRERVEWEESIYGYLLRSVRNACINHKLRRETDRRHRDAVLAQAAEAGDGAPDEQTPEEVRRTLEAQLEQLPEKCREIFVMGTLDGMSYLDIAERLGISVNTVKTQLRRAKGKLRG